MKIIITALICACLFVACTKNKDNPETPKVEIKETYKFKSIDYSLEKSDDGLQQSVVPIIPLVFNNSTTLTQSVRFNPAESVKETSYFQSDDKNAFDLVNMDSVKISIPSYITGDKISLGSKKWQYANKQLEQASAATLKDSVSVAANHTVTVKVNVILQKLTTTYTAIFEGQQTGKLVTVKGSWTGSSPVGANITLQ